MASIIHRPNGHKWIQFTGLGGKRQTVRIGKATEQQATDCRQLIERLLAARSMGQAPDLQTAQWVARLSPVLHKRMAAVGLVDGLQIATLGELLDEFDKSINVKAVTKAHLKVVKDNLRRFFGADKLLSLITPADAQSFRSWIAQHGGHKGGKLASTTVSRRCRRAKQIFQFAINKRWLTESPFKGMSGWNEVNRSRDFAVSRELIERVLDHIPSAEFRAVVALARFGGLRCPSEILKMTWDQIDWERDQFIVRSPKTARHEGQEQRVVPMFPEVKKALLELAEQPVDEAQPLLFPNLQVSGTALKNRLETACRAARVPLWYKPWQNMRATRVTELVEVFPIQVVAAWLGHSPVVAVKHYAQVAKEHFELAVRGFEKSQKPVLRVTDSEPKAK